MPASRIGLRTPLHFLAAFFSMAAAMNAASVEEAAGLIQRREFAKAELLLAPLVLAEPNNAAACYYYGMARREGADAKRMSDAIEWLKKAATLAPDNAEYAADYGGACLLLAEMNQSLLMAIHGRDALERALELDPSDLDTRHALFEFYMQAPWPIGSTKKASVHLDKMSRSNPARAAALKIRLKTEAYEFDEAFLESEALLKNNDQDYLALYEYGWCAFRSGHNLERGIECLQRTLSLSAPSPASPTPTKVWYLIGALEHKSGHESNARMAYSRALQIDPTNAPAATALAKLK